MHILMKEAKHIRSCRKKNGRFSLLKCIRVLWGRSYAINLLNIRKFSKFLFRLSYFLTLKHVLLSH